MAKKETPAERLNTLIAEIDKRQAEKAQKIEKLEKETATAEAAYNTADDAYITAKENLDAAEMIKAKEELNAAGEVLAMFRDALTKEKRGNAFSYDEVSQKYREFDSINKEMTAEANKAICALLAEIENVINDANKAAANLDARFKEINVNNMVNCGVMNAGQLVKNLSGTISHTRQNFAEFWPNK